LSFENTILVVSASIAGCITMIGCFITFQYAKSRKNKLIFLFSINWLCQSMFWVFVALAHFNYSILLMQIAIIPQCFGVACFVIFLELISSENVNSLRFSILTIITFFLLFFTFYHGELVIIPGYGVHNAGLVRFFQIIFSPVPY